MASTSVPKPPIDRRAPTGSRGRRSRSRDVGTTAIVATRATTPIGTLTKKTEPHQNTSSKNPPPMRPIAPPAPANPDQIAIAFARSCGGKTTVMMERVAGMIRAAPIPITDLEAIRRIAEVENDAAIAPPMKMPRPMRRALRRPYRSPRAPAGSSKPANTRAYESKIQSSSVLEVSSASRIVGIARLSELIPATTRMRHRVITTSTHRRFG